MNFEVHLDLRMSSCGIVTNEIHAFGHGIWGCRTLLRLMLYSNRSNRREAAEQHCGVETHWTGTIGRGTSLSLLENLSSSWASEPNDISISQELHMYYKHSELAAFGTTIRCSPHFIHSSRRSRAWVCILCATWTAGMYIRGLQCVLT